MAYILERHDIFITNKLFNDVGRKNGDDDIGSAGILQKAGKPTHELYLVRGEEGRWQFTSRASSILADQQDIFITNKSFDDVGRKMDNNDSKNAGILQKAVKPNYEGWDMEEADMEAFEERNRRAARAVNLDCYPQEQ